MIRITWTNYKQKAHNMTRLAKQVGSRHASAWGAEVAEVGKESINYTILSGGVHKSGKGGPRIDTEAMINSLFGDSKNNAGHVTVRAGYMRPPYWTKFQEFGTRDRLMAGSADDLTATSSGSGIPAMLSLAQAEQHMKVAIDDSGTKMLWQIAKEWNSSV